MRILSVGEILWDVFAEKEFLGGAPLNFSVSAQRLGNDVTLLSAVGTDPRGNLAISSMQALGLAADRVQRVSGARTGTAVVSTDNGGNATFSIDRPAAFDFVILDDSLLDGICRMPPDWIYFGTLAQTMSAAEQRLNRLLEANPGIRCFYDMNLRKGHWNLPLVQRLSRMASIIKLNETEAQELYERVNGPLPFSIEAFCKIWSSACGGEIFCVTLGSMGCAIWRSGDFQIFRGFAVPVVDTVGAGDAFAAAFLHGFQSGWPAARTASFANAAGAIVASRAGATPVWTMGECLQLIAAPCTR